MFLVLSHSGAFRAWGFSGSGLSSTLAYGLHAIPNFPFFYHLEDQAADLEARGGNRNGALHREGCGDVYIAEIDFSFIFGVCKSRGAA
jgi:hypothetical protein